MTPDELKIAKKVMRAEILARRDAMPTEERMAASEKIIAALQQLSAYKDAPVVLTYMGFGAEVNTAPFLETILADGKIAVLPKINKPANRADWALNLHIVGGPEDLIPGVWGIREPLPHLPIVEVGRIGFALIPGLAFDRRGGRLGYGGGFYDRLLSSTSSMKVRACAAFSCQLVDAVPTGANDQRVNMIITENETITCP